ncbi:MAG TPA: FG-GAP-like repeat-containing protein [Gammaproteobacteria bacterium]|nr:FG-GAP-like repeat-containing protein [Gammaproteobacteria bacterium]
MTLLAGAIYASAAGPLPFTETFDDATLSDASNTAPPAADWGVTTPGKLTMPTAQPLTDSFGPGSEAVTLGGDPTITRGLALADLNGDGYLDIVDSASGVNGVLLNDGTGNFPTWTALTDDEGNSRGVATGDVNGDGYIDIVVGNLDNEPSRLYLNSGDGVHFTGFDITPDRLPTDSIVLADVNGDGHLDVVTGNHAKWWDRVYVNTGDPAAPFGPNGLEGYKIVQGLSAAPDTQEVMAGDLDNDGSIDLVFMNQNEINTYCLNDGKGNFDCHALGSEAKDSQSGAVGDFNGDGFLDIVVGNFDVGQTNDLYLNKGVNSTGAPFDGVTPIPITSPNMISYVHRVAVADVDNDGDLDVLLSTAGFHDTVRYTNRLLLNNGPGSGPTFTPVEIGSETNITNYLAVGDVDGDGKPDIIAGNEDRDSMDIALPYPNYLFRNTGTPGGTAALQLKGHAKSLQVNTSTGDIDSVAMTIDPPAFGLHNHADFWVSSNGGTKWLHIAPNGQPVQIPADLQGHDLGWRVDVHSLSPAADVGAPAFAIDSLTLTSDAPVFTSSPVTDGTVGAAYEYDVTASDPNGDTLSFTAPTLPAWLTFTDNTDGTATLTGTPEEDNAGDNAVELDASDGTHTTPQSFVVHVGGAPNSPPSFTSQPVTAATAGTAYSYAVEASDADAGDSMIFAAPTLPAWLQLMDNGDGTATLAGTPAAGDVGADQAVELTVTDAAGASAKQDFKVTVAAAGGGDTAPSFMSDPVEAAKAGTAYSYSVKTTDPDSGDKLALTAPTLPAWLQLTDNGDGTATLAGTPAAGDVGNAPTELQVADTAGETAKQSFTIAVAAAGGSPPPPPPPSNDGGGGSTGVGGLGALLLLAVLRKRQDAQRRR